MKFKNGQNKFVILEVRKMGNSDEESCKGH